MYSNSCLLSSLIITILTPCMMSLQVSVIINWRQLTFLVAGKFPNDWPMGLKILSTLRRKICIVCSFSKPLIRPWWVWKKDSVSRISTNIASWPLHSPLERWIPSSLMSILSFHFFHKSLASFIPSFVGTRLRTSASSSREWFQKSGPCSHTLKDYYVFVSFRQQAHALLSDHSVPFAGWRRGCVLQWHSTDWTTSWFATSTATFFRSWTAQKLHSTSHITSITLNIHDTLKL